MGNSVSAGRPRITVVNGTRKDVRVAVYKRSPLCPKQPTIAWQVVSPPPQGKTAIFIPRDCQVCARYSFEPENPGRPVYQTNVIEVPHAPAGGEIVIESVSTPDRRTWGALLTRSAQDPGRYRIRVINRFAIGVWSHVRQDGRDLFPPRILPPMAAWTEELDSSFRVAVLASSRAAGDLLLDSEIVLTEIAVKVGECVVVRGGARKGFEISRIPQGDSALAVEPDVWADAQEPRVPEEEPKVAGKVEAITRKREAVKKPAKKPAKRTPKEPARPQRGSGKIRNRKAPPSRPAQDMEDSL